LKRSGLRDLGTEDEANEAPFSLAELPTGWVILFSNDFDFGAPENLINVSAGAVIISSQVEEHSMFSGAYCYANGREAWRVCHDSARGRHHLATQGTLPPEFEPIRIRLSAQQADNDRAEGDVDYIFDVPIELAAELTGYRHDRWKFDWGIPRFTALERDG